MNSATIADAVKTLITATVTAQSAGATLTRTYAPEVPLETLKTAADGTLFVYVIPRKRVGGRYARASWLRDVTIDIGVYARCDSDTTADSLSAFLETLAALLETTLPTVSVSLGLIGDAVTIENLFDMTLMDQKGIFAAVVSATYRWAT